jgi:hypothetical protein
MTLLFSSPYQGGLLQNSPPQLIGLPRQQPEQAAQFKEATIGEYFK